MNRDGDVDKASREGGEWVFGAARFFFPSCKGGSSLPPFRPGRGRAPPGLAHAGREWIHGLAHHRELGRLVHRGLMAVPIYAVQHLEHANPAASLPADRLIALLADAAEARGRVLPPPGLLSAVALRLAQALKTATPTAHPDAPAFEKLDDRSLVCMAVVSAHASMLTPPTVLDASGELLWAAAASLLKHHRVSHPNDLQDSTS